MTSLKENFHAVVGLICQSCNEEIKTIKHFTPNIPNSAEYRCAGCEELLSSVAIKIAFPWMKVIQSKNFEAS